MEKSVKSSKYEKASSYGILVLLILMLVPIFWLGKYNHPTGDDYYYTATTHLVWEETGSVGAVLKAALQGVAKEYQIWQGTYSAMFLMYLSPNLFGDWAYRLVTGAIVLSLVGSVFWFLKPLVCDWLKGSKALWVMASSVLSLLCIQTVPSQGESFFWYNGSMYYTGYFAVTLVLFGILLRWLEKGGVGKVVAMVFLAAFLAGGNYVSLLPGLLMLFTIAALLAYKKDRRARTVALVALVMLGGLIVSAMAPGNQVRQSDMWKIPAWKAVLKSLLQGVNYFTAWTGIWWILAALLITPFLWKALKRVEFKFPLPLVVVGYLYGIFCSMSCPTFYTMNSTGPARAVAIVYYGYIVISFLCYGYLLGYIQKKWFGERKTAAESPKTEKMRAATPWIFGGASLLLLMVQFLTGAVGELTTAKAVELLASGEAAAYEQEYQERLEILEDDSIKDVVLTPYEHQPEMLYVGDISEDAQDDTNVKIAEYFGKNSVKVEY